MKVKVKLYGTLRQPFPDDQHSMGIEVEIPDGATVKDLLTILELPESQGAVVIAEGRVLKAGDKLQHRVPVNVFQAIRGG
jgi:sulfur carrier protein ThiS